MNSSAEQVIQNELDSGERLLWGDIPRQGIVLRSSDICVIPFSLMCGGFAIYREYLALTTVRGSDMANQSAGADFIFPLLGIPLVLIGLYMIFGRFIYDNKKRSRTAPISVIPAACYSGVMIRSE